MAARKWGILTSNSTIMGQSGVRNAKKEANREGKAAFAMKREKQIELG